MDAMVCFNRACGCCCVVINRSQDIREQFVEKVSNLSSIAMTSPTSVLLRLSMRISTPLPVFFPDTEATFALIGSFFSLHARDEYGGSFEVNPRLWRTSCWQPRSTATHGCTMQSRCSFSFCPGWDDSPGYEAPKQSPLLRHLKFVRKRDHTSLPLGGVRRLLWVCDAKRRGGQSGPSTMPSSMDCFG